MQTDEDPSLDKAYDLKGPEDNKRLYRSWAASYDADFVDASGYRLAYVVARRFLELGGTGPLLDIGCGTGQVAGHLPADIVVDGLDLSADMLAVAVQKGRYRNLVEADVTRPLPVPERHYAGWISAGTFTHGHVGPEVLPNLTALLRPGGLAVFSGNSTFFQAAGFQDVLDGLVAERQISDLCVTEEKIYENEAAAPAGHGQDIGKLVTMRAV